jgi:hypothetical protein
MLLYGIFIINLDYIYTDYSYYDKEKNFVIQYNLFVKRDKRCRKGEYSIILFFISSMLIPFILDRYKLIFKNKIYLRIILFPLLCIVL